MGDPSNPSRFKPLFEAALQNYERQTGTKLVDHPLAKQLETCHSVESITAFFQEQVSAFHEFRDDGKMMRSLKSAVPVLHALSTCSALRDSISAPFPPAKAIFASLAILFAAIKGVSASFDALINLLECIGRFLDRLDVYTKIPPTPVVTGVIVEIIIELISTLALETNVVKQGRLRKFVKKLFGENRVEDALKRLDSLVQEESRASGAQALAIVYGIDQKINVLLDDGKSFAASAPETSKFPQKKASDMNKANREKLRQDLQNWLSPPDPWKNHNTAYKSHHRGTATWFLEGNTYSEWKSCSPSSLLWIHGKPGAGKSVLCSAIIEDINRKRNSGQSSLAFFYCDFREDKKKDRRGLLSSLLVQLCDQSDSYCDILSDFYLAHRRGSQHPGGDALLECFIRIAQASGEAPVFVVVDALDELPNTTGMPSPREEVLDLVTGLVDLQIPNLHICITSRPEADIQLVLEHLSFHSISLHSESGQMQDIVEYVKSVVNTNPTMRRWKAVDKELVINVLNEKADGMFRWVFCQLVFLRRCIPARIRYALEELPESLDETYERILRDIEDQNWEYAHHVFEFIAVASRPLCLEELAELLAVDFDSGGIPTFLADWRLEDPGKDVLSMCSSLLSIVQVGNSQVIEFSHFSVKEYLMSARLAKARDVISRYRVSMTPAHTTVAQACLGVLLQLDKTINRHKLKSLPLVGYASQHLADHARFEGVWSKTQGGMKRLFDPDRPHLAVWVWVYHPGVPFLHRPRASSSPSQPPGTALHYAAYYGLHDIAEFLVIELSQDVNAQGFSDKSTPLHVTSSVRVARLLLEHGADATAEDSGKRTPLHQVWNVEVAQLLLEHGADARAKDHFYRTPLHEARSVVVVRLLLERGADATARDEQNRTPLHDTESVEIAQLLLEHGADARAGDDYNRTPLHTACSVELTRLLLEHGADAAAQDDSCRTPLHDAGSPERARILLEHGADPTAQEHYTKRTPLHEAESVEVTRLLLEYGADARAQDNYDRTPLHEAKSLERARLLLDYGADAGAQDGSQRAPLHEAGSAELAQLLIDYGADARAQDSYNRTPLHSVSSVQHARLLLDHGAEVTARDGFSRTPLHEAESAELTRLLLERGADAKAQDDSQRTPLHQARSVEVARLLLEHGANVTAQDDYKRTPLHDACSAVEVAQFLLEHGADATAQDDHKRTPLHEAENAELVRLLLDYGADATARDENMRTPLHEEGGVERAQLLLDHGADATALDNYSCTPLHEARSAEVARLLLDRGANPIALDCDNETPLHWASRRGDVEVAQLLFRHSAYSNAQDGAYRILLEEAEINRSRGEGQVSFR